MYSIVFPDVESWGGVVGAAMQPCRWSCDGQSSDGAMCPVGCKLSPTQTIICAPSSFEHANSVEPSTAFQMFLSNTSGLLLLFHTWQREDGWVSDTDAACTTRYSL